MKDLIESYTFRFREVPESYARVVILHFSHIGDLLWLTPLVKALFISGKSVSIVCDIQYKNVFENNPSVEKLYFDNLREENALLHKREAFEGLLMESFDLLLNTESTLFASKLSQKISASCKIGFVEEAKNKIILYGNLATVYSKVPRLSPEFQDDFKDLRLNHAVFSNLSLLGKKGEFEYQFWSDEKAIIEASEVLKKIAEEKPIVCISPVSSDPQKSWPTDYWKKLAELLSQIATVVVVAQEVATVAYLKELEGVIILANRTLKTVFEVLKHVNLVITNDSGILHLAQAASVRTVVISGPTVFTLTGPVKDNSYVVESPTNCKNCVVFPKNCEKQQCLTDIRPETVLKLAKVILAGEIPESAENCMLYKINIMKTEDLTFLVPEKLGSAENENIKFMNLLYALLLSMLVIKKIDPAYFSKYDFTTEISEIETKKVKKIIDQFQPGLFPALQHLEVLQVKLEKKFAQLKQQYLSFLNFRKALLQPETHYETLDLKVFAANLLEFVESFSREKEYILFDYYNKLHINKTTPDEEDKLLQIDIFLKTMHDDLKLFLKIIDLIKMKL